jgi:upstream activation factor subunit UAF30
MPSKTKQPTPSKTADATKGSSAKKANATPAESTAAKKAGPAKGTSSKAASAGKSASGKKVNPALMKPLQPSKELAAVVGSDPLPRPEVVSKVWDYIKRNNAEQARDQGRRQAGEGVRQEERHDVRDEQTPRPAPEIAGA